MSNFYSGFQKMATTLLKQFGQPAQVSRAGISLGKANALFSKGNTTLDAIGQVQLAAETRHLLLSNLKQPVEVGDIIKINKETYIIKALNKTAPTDVTIYYSCEVAPWQE